MHNHKDLKNKGNRNAKRWMMKTGNDDAILYENMSVQTV